MSLTCLFASAKIPIQGGVEVVYADFPPPFPILEGGKPFNISLLSIIQGQIFIL